MSRTPGVVALCALAMAAVASGAMAKPASARVVRHHAGARVVRSGRDLPTVQVVRTSITAAEPTVAFDRQGRVYADAFHPLATPAGNVTRPTVMRFTADGSATAEVGPQHPVSQDPYLYSDPATGRVFSVDLTGDECSALSYTDDGGTTWSNHVAGCSLTDHESVAAGPAPAGGSKPTGYPNVVYYCSFRPGTLATTSFGDGCERSLDGGDTWLPTLGQPFLYDPTAGCLDKYYSLNTGCDGTNGQPVVAPNGDVLLPRGFAGQPWLAVSDDEGDSWRRVQIAGNGLREDSIGIPSSQTSVAADSAGNLYYSWVARDRMPYLSWSRDHGRTWTRPLMIGKPGLHQTWQSVLDALVPGKVAVQYIATEDGAAAPFPDDRYCRSTDPEHDAELGLQVVLDAAGLPSGCPAATKDYATTTWNAYLTVSADLFAHDPVFTSAQLNPDGDPIEVGYCAERCPHEYDFTDVHINPYDGTPWAVYVDGCTSATACAPAKQGLLQLARLRGVDLGIDERHHQVRTPS